MHARFSIQTLIRRTSNFELIIAVFTCSIADEEQGAPASTTGFLLRLHVFQDELEVDRLCVAGVIDVPDYRASIAVSGFWLPCQGGSPSDANGTLFLMEREIVDGNAGIGWKPRHGHNYWYVMS